MLEHNLPTSTNPDGEIKVDPPVEQIPPPITIRWKDEFGTLTLTIPRGKSNEIKQA